MRLTLPSFEVNPKDPFNKEDDIFERREFAERLANLIKNSEDDSLVISLNAQWGEGKTTFIKMFNQHLKNQGATTIYFDAFAHDYIDDAFSAITMEICSKITEKIPDAEFEKQLPDYAKKFLAIGMKAGAKILQNNIGLADTDLKEIIEGAGDAVTDIIKEKIDKYKQNKASIESFKKELEKLAEALKQEQKNKFEKLAETQAEYKDKKPFPLVFIVDELDRCKPTYALDVIEKIKHFFSVKNVIFILVMNKKQMETSIKSVYGDEIEASIYLQKFINLESILPKEISSHHNTDIYCDYLKKQHNLCWDNKNIRLELTQDLTKTIATMGELSLRDLERYYTYFTLYYSVLKKDAFILPILISFLISLKVKEHPIYQKFKNGNLAYQELESTSIWYKTLKDKITSDNLLKPIIRVKGYDQYLPVDYFNLYHWMKLCSSDAKGGSTNIITQELATYCNYYKIASDKVIPDICNKIDSFEFVSE